MTISEAAAVRPKAQFPAGSMGPKIEGGDRIPGTLDATQRRKSLITSCEQIKQAIAGKIGTRIVST